jgi:FkbM family methyltransferase
MKEIVFDIGANKGWETEDPRLCAYHTKRPWYEHYKVICVEPTPSLCEELQEKFTDADVEVIHAAVTDEETATVDFYISREHTLSTCSKERMDDTENTHHHAYQDSEKITVPTTRIDTLVKTYGKPSFIKIDVEGYEWRVLNTFAENYCPISFEWSEQETTNLRKTLARCQELGYTKFWITFGNVGIQNTPEKLAEALYACEYWRRQANWMNDFAAFAWGALPYEQVVGYIDRVCVKTRVWTQNGVGYKTDPLWGQIYAE